MPRDVATRWNSTFDMLDYALEHRKAVDNVTQRRDLGLRKYELADREWEIVKQLRDVLKVCICHCVTMIKTCLPHVLDSQGCDFVLLSFNTKPCYCDPCHGSYWPGAHIILARQDIFCPNSRSCSTCKEDSESILWTYRQFRSLSHRYGYVLHIVPLPFVINIFLQFYIRDISYLTSRLLTGKTNGSRRQSPSFAMNLSVHTYQPTMIQRSRW